MTFTAEQLVSLRQAYDQEVNLTELILSWGVPLDFEAISIIYEFQSGSYTKFTNENPAFSDSFTSEIAGTIRSFLKEDMTVLDCGTGEGTSMISILKKLGMQSGYAIDASISRLLWAQRNSATDGINLNLAVADIGQLPILDNTVDVVVTVHALEPNYGRESKLIKELGRVSRRFIFLIEPDFEKSSTEQKERMMKLGYVRQLDEVIKKNNFRILDKASLVNNYNEYNQASITIIDTGKTNEEKSHLTWVDPIQKDKLLPYMNGLRSNLGIWYPVVNGIPLLRITDAQYVLSPPT